VNLQGDSFSPVAFLPDGSTNCNDAKISKNHTNLLPCKRSANTEFIYWSSVVCRGLNVEGEGKMSRARVKSRGRG
jgi:hypothetical protein